MFEKLWNDGWWVVFAQLIVAIPLGGLAFWGWWHNRQVDKYNEWVKEHGEPEEATQN